RGTHPRQSPNKGRVTPDTPHGQPLVTHCDTATLRPDNAAAPAASWSSPAQVSASATGSHSRRGDECRLIARYLVTRTGCGEVRVLHATARSQPTVVDATVTSSQGTTLRETSFGSSWSCARASGQRSITGFSSGDTAARAYCCATILLPRVPP